MFFFVLYSSVANIVWFLTWIAAELSSSGGFSNVDTLSLQTVLSAPSCNWFRQLSDVYHTTSILRDSMRTEIQQKIFFKLSDV